MHKDVSGEKYGRLLVIEPVGRDYNQNVIWKCKCDCGNETTATYSSLRQGHKQSCGCLARESAKIQLQKNAKRVTHGGSNERLYMIYHGIIRRCENKHDSRYSEYGGRGIKICDEWRNDYTKFREFALANGYNPNGEYGETTIERIDVNGNYCPENCCWASQKEQQNNKRNNRRLTLGDVTLTVSQWADKLGIPQSTILSRLHYGWDVDRVLTEPVHNNGRKRVAACEQH